LETVYRSQGDYTALAGLFEKRISYASTPGERVRMRLDLARVLEERSNNSRAAQTVLEKALADDPGDLDVLNEIERLAPINGGWTTAADALEQAVSSNSDLTPDVARELWMRIAGWRKDKINDPAAAERALEAALKHDSTNEEILRQIE